MTTGTLERLQDGKPHAISQAEYESFLDVLPPVCGQTAYQGERWEFGFAEGTDNVYLFRRRGDRCYAVRTPFLNPYEAGGFDIQKRRWIQRWIELAEQSPLYIRAGRSLFDTPTFDECESDHNFLEKIQHAEWRDRQALFVGDLCFIKLSASGDDWLTLKGPTILGPVDFRRMIEPGGVEAAQHYIDWLRSAAPILSAERSRKGRSR